jgi:hypothetical protein
VDDGRAAVVLRHGGAVRALSSTLKIMAILAIRNGGGLVILLVLAVFDRAYLHALSARRLLLHLSRNTILRRTYPAHTPDVSRAARCTRRNAGRRAGEQRQRESGHTSRKGVFNAITTNKATLIPSQRHLFEIPDDDHPPA